MKLTRALANAAAFRKHKRGTQDDIRNFQDRRLREIIEHAYANVPYYRRLFDANGIKPSMIRGVEDLRLIPVTRKADLKDLPITDRLARDVEQRQVISHTTGGSTGEPFTICRSWIEERTLGLVRRRALEDYGVGRGSVVAIATYYYKPKSNDHEWLDKAIGSLVGARLRGVFAADQPSQVLANIAKMKPDVIAGYAGLLDRMAQHVLQHGLSFNRPDCVLSGAEILTDTARVRIREAFGAPVYDTYGAHEFSRIAWECPRSGEYHRADDSVITEIRVGDRAASYGEEGSLVGTSLHTYSMPFIRYELGDTITQGRDRCPCGAPFSTLLKIRGREVDYFVTSDGQLLHPFILADALKPSAFRWVGKYQIVQETLTDVALTAETKHAPTQEELDAAVTAARRVLGHDVRFSINLVNELKPDPNGKLRIYHSKVARN